MKKRTIGIVLIGILVASGFIIYANWITVRNTIVQALKTQVRKDFLTQNNTAPTSNTNHFDDRFSFAVVTDIHNNTQGLNSAVSEINNSPVKFTIGLGDYTNVGTPEEFQKIKKITNTLKKPFYALPGDHDLWNGRDKTDSPLHYFYQYFATTPAKLSEPETTVLFVDNADIYTGVPEDKRIEFSSNLANANTPLIIIVSHKAFWHPLTIHRMGYINDQKNEEVSAQADQIMKSINAKKGSKLILISGDLHTFSKYSVPTDNFEAYTIGALTETKNFQTPRYAIVHIGKDNKVEIEDRAIAQ